MSDGELASAAQSALAMASLASAHQSATIADAKRMVCTSVYMPSIPSFLGKACCFVGWCHKVRSMSEFGRALQWQQVLHTFAALNSGPTVHAD